MELLLDAIAEMKDIIVLDSPPIAALTDASVLANKVDGVVLVVEVGKTRLTDLQHAKEQLERSGAYIIGVVFNKAPRERSSYYCYNYSSYYYNSTYREDENSKHGFLRQPVSHMQFFAKKQLTRNTLKEDKEKASSCV
jgi:Mrp family chromosome partitioning ATPase